MKLSSAGYACVAFAFVLVAPANAETVVTTDGGLEISSPDGAFSFELGGRLMIDTARYQEDRTPLHDGSEVRRVRLEMAGVLDYDWEYELAYDFAENEPEVKDAWIGYNPDDRSRLSVGNFKEPFSLEEMTSSKYITFMERALPNAFAPGRRLGVGYFRHGSDWSVNGGWFSETVEDSGEDLDAGQSLGLRLTYAPRAGAADALHLGAAVNCRWPGEDEKVRFRSRPESHVTDVRLVNTDNLNDDGEVEQMVLAGLEAAWVRGPYSLQGEYMQARVERDGGGPLVFTGSYGYASWFLTGESRVYKAKGGKFGRVKPIAPGGAWEVALRVSRIDLEEDDVAGGVQTDTTLGVNWYVNPHVRFMVNYIVVDTAPSEAAEGDVAAPGESDDPHIVQLRAQVDF